MRRAFNFGYPIYEMVRVREEMLARMQALGNGGVNRFAHRRTLTDHTNRAVTTPNNDTIYSAAWLDLSAGPVTVSVPESRDRYLSVVFLDVFTDNFAYAGTRGSAGRAERLYVVGPTWSGQTPPGTRLIRAPTNTVWALARTLVDGPDDLAAAVAVQSRIVADGPSLSRAALPPLPLRPTPAEFLGVVNRALGEAPVPATHRARADALRRFGIQPGRENAWSRLSPAVRDAWTSNWPALNDGLRGAFQRFADLRNGWTYLRPGLGAFGQDDAYRAGIALEGLGALEPGEAMYMFARVDGRGAILDGRSSYRITLPAQVPIRAFWSLSMYELANDRMFFVDNPLRRYAIGNRTRGLIRNPDGTITIHIQRTPPSEALRANWLPAPEGEFVLGFRAYLPEPTMLGGAFTLPPVLLQE